jgi:hypothetical protein
VYVTKEDVELTPANPHGFMLSTAAYLSF